MSQTSETSVSRQFEDLTYLFYLMVAFPLVAFIWIYLNLNSIRPWGYFADPDFKVYLHAILLLLALLLAVLAFVKYRNRFYGLEPQADIPHGKEEGAKQRVRQKLPVFIKAARQQHLLLTLATVLVVLGYYLSAEPYYAALYGVVIVIFSVYRPTPERFISDMRLSKEERHALREIFQQERSEDKG